MGDTSAFEHVLSPSANPLDEHAEPVGTVYPEFTHSDGRYSPLRGRRQILVDANTGEQLDAHITEIRAADARSHFGVGRHVVAVEDDGLGGEFSDATYPHYDGPDTMRGYRRTPGTDGYRLPSMYSRRRGLRRALKGCLTM
jgi:hypothetical protein